MHGKLQSIGYSLHKWHNTNVSHAIGKHQISKHSLWNYNRFQLNQILHSPIRQVVVCLEMYIWCLYVYCHISPVFWRTFLTHSRQCYISTSTWRPNHFWIIASEKSQYDLSTANKLRAQYLCSTGGVYNKSYQSPENTNEYIWIK